MSSRRLFCCIAFSLLALTGCVSIPDTYAPPMQRKPVTGPEPSSLREFVRVDEPAAEVHFLRDISPHVEAGRFRWTQQKPTFQFQLKDISHRKLRLEFHLHSDVLKATGPLTIKYSVNGRPLESVTYTKDGAQIFEKLVPLNWLTVDSPTVVTANLSGTLKTPDGNSLGLILTAAGFLE
ncbi:MAG TPA: hypothetical protein DEH78_02470 [Solibacterales bacterium]|nr:hypothetical protein [Bryobacterales bacterium]